MTCDKNNCNCSKNCCGCRNWKRSLIWAIAIIVVVFLTNGCDSIREIQIQSEYQRPSTYYPIYYHSFYNAGGLGYYSNFYRPVYPSYRARPFVRNHRNTSIRRVQPKVVKPVRRPKTVRLQEGKVIIRTNKGRRNDK